MVAWPKQVEVVPHAGVLRGCPLRGEQPHLADGWMQCYQGILRDAAAVFCRCQQQTQMTVCPRIDCQQATASSYLPTPLSSGHSLQPGRGTASALLRPGMTTLAASLPRRPHQGRTSLRLLLLGLEHHAVLLAALGLCPAVEACCCYCCRRHQQSHLQRCRQPPQALAIPPSRHSSLHRIGMLLLLLLPQLLTAGRWVAESCHPPPLLQRRLCGRRGCRARQWARRARARVRHPLPPLRCHCPQTPRQPRPRLQSAAVLLERPLRTPLRLRLSSPLRLFLELLRPAGLKAMLPAHGMASLESELTCRHLRPHCCQAPRRSHLRLQLQLQPTWLQCLLVMLRRSELVVPRGWT
mmetsp:Transcript_71348/g.170844  ORF Transcript_71348/g.170844 Transcript_71348/m.170844 type:complete len:352 (-) Transcript_71348:1706-2761(-)